MKINELKTFVKTVLKSDKHIPMMLWSGPGIGKSSAVRQAAEELGMGFIDLRLSILNPVDLRGLPVVDRENKSAEWFAPAFLPVTVTKNVKGKEVEVVMANGREVNSKGVVQLDEINLAPAATMAAGYQLILDRKLGEYVLPTGWKIMAAGNRSEDNANVTKFPAPLANRFVHLELEPDNKEWIKWGLGANSTEVGKTRIHEHILSFIGRFPQHLYEFPKNSEKTFPSPRSWEMASNLYYVGLDIDSAVGQGVAATFRGFIKVFDKMPDVELVMQGKEKKVPKEIDVLWALCMAILAKAEPKYIDNIIAYVMGMPIEFQVVTLTGLSDRSEALDIAVTGSKKYEDWIMENREYISEELNISIKDRKDLEEGN